MSTSSKIKRETAQDDPIGKVGARCGSLAEFPVAVILVIESLVEQILYTQTDNAAALWKPVANRGIDKEKVVITVRLKCGI